MMMIGAVVSNLNTQRTANGVILAVTIRSSEIRKETEIPANFNEIPAAVMVAIDVFSLVILQENVLMKT